jgi:hypothetical protein
MAETLFRQWFIEEAKEDWDEVTVSSLFEVRWYTRFTKTESDRLPTCYIKAYW